MIGARTEVTKQTNASRNVREGTRKALMDAAAAGYNTSQEEVPHGATSTLANSGVQPTELQDGSIVWGYSAEYARYVEEGTGPHWVPIEHLLKWARRVLGDEGAAYAVQKKIAEEGTDPQRFVQKGIRAMKAHLSGFGIGASIEEEL